jgi:hypothetical protein
MDTEGIGFFLGQLYGISCYACDIGINFYTMKLGENCYLPFDNIAQVYSKN